MRNLRIVYGFASEKTADSIEKAIKGYGYGIQSKMQPTKQMLKDYLEQHDVDAVILKEFLDGGERYSIKELVDLADNVNVNIIAIIGTGYRGKDELKDLYNAGILNAIFSDGKRGVDPNDIAAFCIRGRTRREAREYYRIDREIIKKRFLTHDEYLEMYRYLANNALGINLMERFITVSRWVEPEQLAIFMKTLPEGAVDSLKQFKEFYPIYNDLVRFGYFPAKLKCPKEAIEGVGPKQLKEAGNEPKRERDNIPADIRPVNSSRGMYESVIKEESRATVDGRVYSGGSSSGMNTDFRDYIDNQMQSSMGGGYYPPPFNEVQTPQDSLERESIEVTMMQTGIGQTGAGSSTGNGLPDETIDYDNMDVDSLIDMMG